MLEGDMLHNHMWYELLSYNIHFQKAGINTSWELTSHFVFLEKY